jgi:hypothetical protein
MLLAFSLPGKDVELVASFDLVLFLDSKRPKVSSMNFYKYTIHLSNLQ